MSSELATGGATNMFCASCGKEAEVDDIKLKDCPHCDLAKYCSDECQQNHREGHEAICKKRATELRDELLFRQNEGSFNGDCPICFLPMPLDAQKYTFYFCCCKYICKGCELANDIREERERLKPRCPFCRKLVPDNDEEGNKILMKRAAANDPVALRRIGSVKYQEGDYDSAFEYWTRVAALGDALAHYNLSTMYWNGYGVDKDEKMRIYHLEEAAIAGHPKARFNLGCLEGQNGRFDRAVKHFIIAANLGDDDSMQTLKECYKEGLVSKDDLAKALRAHHAAVSAIKSPQREAAEKLLH